MSSSSTHLTGIGRGDVTDRPGQRGGAPVDPPDFLAAAQSPEFQADPYPWFDELRTADPVHHTAYGVWLVSRHADATAVVRDPRLSNDERNRSEQSTKETRGELDEGLLLFLDPPEHTRIRALVNRAFTPRTVERLRERVHHLVDHFLDTADASGRGRIDVVTDLAYPLPITLICELLGVPPDDHRTFQVWSRELAGSIDPQPLRTPEQDARIEAAAAEFGGYFADLVRHRRQHLGDDLLSALIAAEQDGDRLSERELLNTGLFLLVAGHETTVNLIGNGVLALLRNPDELARLRTDPSLDRHAIEELLRFDSPVQLTQRITLNDHDVGGVIVPAGQTLIPLLGAANHDPAAFVEPHRLDLTRDDAHRHLAFGGGHHLCLGAALARLEGEIAITSLVRRYPALELDGEPSRRQTFTLRGLENLPVSIGARP